MNRILHFFVIFLAALSATSLAFEGDDFVSASYDPRDPEKPAMVLRVPRTERIASVWNPPAEKLPFSTDEVVKLVLESELVRHTPNEWRILQVSFSAMSPVLYSNLSFIEGAPPGLITHWKVELSHPSDGAAYVFMVLMNGKIFSPKPERQEPTRK